MTIEVRTVHRTVTERRVDVLESLMHILGAWLESLHMSVGDLILLKQNKSLNVFQ